MIDIDDLLATEKSRPGFSPEARAALWKGIEQSVGAATAAAAVTTAATVGTKAATSTAAKIASWKIAAIASVALAVGAGGGAAAHAKFAAPRVVVVDAPVAIATVAPPPLPSAAPVVDAPVVAASALPSVATARVQVIATASASAAPKDPGLARERALLDMARTALTRGDASSALTAVDTHAKEFPKSQLGQEREVIAIQALAAAGRMPEAKRRAAAFHAAFPKSPLGSIIDEATQ